MRAKYESLASSVLKELAKSRGIKNVSSMEKSEVVEAMLQKDREDAVGAATAKAEPAKPAPVKAAPKA
ncbi:MAG: Rho termination factor N-terminal domain-containing protein, partial [Lachnospiraceae bacterium]|nr:Rho termination factor N-terminal domain-containing protein [Lachnospiraceae bacterium]